MKVTLYIKYQSQPHVFYGVDYVVQGPSMFQIIWVQNDEHYAVEHSKIRTFTVEKGD